MPELRHRAVGDSDAARPGIDSRQHAADDGPRKPQQDKLPAWPALAIVPYAWARYGHAMRPWSFTVSYFPMLLAALSIVTVPALAETAWDGQEVSFLLRFLLVVVAGLSVHAAANLTNTYYDFVGKVDDEHADDRAILDGHLSPGTVWQMSLALYGVSAAAWALLAQQNGASLIYLAATGGLLGFAYTGQPLGLKYRACGEGIVFLCFGPLLAAATAMSLGMPLTSAGIGLPVLLSLPPAVLAVGVLHSNNARDISSDRAAGTDTLAQRLGPAGCRNFYIALLTLPYLLTAIPTLSSAGVALAWGWRPSLYALLTVPMSTDLYRSYQQGWLAELPQQTAQFHALFCGCIAMSMLSLATLARLMLGLLFILGGGNNFYTWDYTLPLVRDRMKLAVPCHVPDFIPPLALACASLWQISAAAVFISGYGGAGVIRLAAVSLLLFLTPITFIVHDFWSISKYAGNITTRREQWEAAGCTHGGRSPEPSPPTFECQQDSEFVHFWKNVCILGGLVSFALSAGE